jgi:large subunit ribosomal protein L19
MRIALIEHVEKKHLKSQPPQMRIGDTVDVHTRIVEGEKERTQVFNGVVIAMRGPGLNASFVVRRIVANEGVERLFLLHSPRVLKVDVKRHGKVRRAKLFYLRDRVGKARKLKERRRVNTKATRDSTTKDVQPEPVAV